MERQPIPISWVCKDDLLRLRPDLSEQIHALSDAEVEYIAEKVGDALQETYWQAMDIVLTEYWRGDALIGNGGEGTGTP
jgi:hypothetical protein